MDRPTVEHLFGFEFDRRDHLLVSEAFGGAANASALSSYDPSADTGLHLISGSVPTLQSAACCWVVLARHGRYAYVTNTGSGSVTGFRVGRDGSLARLTPSGQTALTGAGPTDAAASRSGELLFVLSPAAGELAAFRVAPDGSLTAAGSANGIPASATGVAAR